MATTFKDAVKKMSNDPNLKYFFFFCEKGKDGKPVMLVDTKKLDPKKDGPAKDALASATAKGTSIGTMVLREKVLSLKPQGPGLSASKLETGVKMASNHAQVQGFIQDVIVGVPEGEKDNKEHADPLRADPAMAKLLDQRAEIQTKIEATIGSGSEADAIKHPAKRKALQQFQVELNDIGTKLEEAQRKLNTTGLATQALRPEYNKEQTEVGDWRAKNSDRERRQAETDEEFKKYLEDYARVVEDYNKACAEIRAKMDSPRAQKADESKETYDKAVALHKRIFQKKLDQLIPPSDKRLQKPAETDEEYADFLKKKEELSKSDLQVTKYFTEQQREDSEVTWNDQGQAVGNTEMNADGTMRSGEKGPLEGKSVDFVMSKTGQMHQFGNKTVETGAEGINPLTGNTAQKKASTHHSSVLAGEDVAAAGEMVLDYQGYLTKINNKSGHYKPGATQVIQLLEELAKQGALLDKSYLMPDPKTGQGIPLAGKPLAMYTMMASLEAGLKGKLAGGKNIEPELAGIKQAKQLLAKLGAAPSNKFRPVEVEFLDGAAEKTGLDIKRGVGTKATAEDFLQTGGGYQDPAMPFKQAEYKAKMHKQIKDKLATKKAELDKNAEALAEKVSEDLAKSVMALPEKFKHYQEELAIALNDKSDEGPAKRKACVAAILRVEAASKSEVAEEALDKVLAELNVMYEKDKAAAAWNTEVDEFSGKDLSWDDYGGKEAVASLLKISVDDLIDLGEGARPFSLTEDGFAGCTTDEELYVKLTGKQSPG